MANLLVFPHLMTTAVVTEALWHSLTAGDTLTVHQLLKSERANLVVILQRAYRLDLYAPDIVHANLWQHVMNCVSRTMSVADRETAMLQFVQKPTHASIAWRLLTDDIRVGTLGCAPELFEQAMRFLQTQPTQTTQSKAQFRAKAFAVLLAQRKRAGEGKVEHKLGHTDGHDGSTLKRTRARDLEAETDASVDDTNVDDINL